MRFIKSKQPRRVESDCALTLSEEDDSSPEVRMIPEGGEYRLGSRRKICFGGSHAGGKQLGNDTS